MTKRGGVDRLLTFTEVLVILPFFEKKWAKIAIKTDFLGVLGSKFQKPLVKRLQNGFLEGSKKIPLKH